MSRFLGDQCSPVIRALALVQAQKLRYVVARWVKIVLSTFNGNFQNGVNLCK